MVNLLEEATAKATSELRVDHTVVAIASGRRGSLQEARIQRNESW